MVSSLSLPRGGIGERSHSSSAKLKARDQGDRLCQSQNVHGATPTSSLEEEEERDPLLGGPQSLLSHLALVLSRTSPIAPLPIPPTPQLPLALFPPDQELHHSYQALLTGCLTRDFRGKWINELVKKASLSERKKDFLKLPLQRLRIVKDDMLEDVLPL
ncbi:hypothetical protein TcWFU_005875 [Taenia crassiceps]|uniref:Uncharacterized protein n=1 Tax=Taenia crassiceps TaxID=6207 RepID=A0ABR4Q1W8_9CEST